MSYSVLPPDVQAAQKDAFEQWVTTINGTVDKVIQSRSQADHVADTDILGTMMNTADPETGQQLSAQNMRYQVTTFIVAGYGTTASLISFALYYLSRNPTLLEQVRQEIAQELGDGEISFESVAKLRRLRRVIDETLRLWAPTPAFLRVAKQDTVLAGAYPVKKGGWAAILTAGLHRDPDWGDDPLKFDPDRFTSANVKGRKPSLYKPFGTGPRNCIGRQFALHAAGLALAETIRQFDVAIPIDYDLTVAEGGFYMPENLLVTVNAR